MESTRFDSARPGSVRFGSAAKGVQLSALHKAGGGESNSFFYSMFSKPDYFHQKETLLFVSIVLNCRDLLLGVWRSLNN